MSLSVITKDVDEAAFYWERGFVLKDTKVEKRQYRSVVFFIFETEMEQAALDALKNSFFNRLATVEPKSFSRKQQDLRDILHQKLRMIQS